MARVADLVKCVNQGILAIGFKCKVEFDLGSSGCVSLTLPVRWNVIPRVHDPLLIPMYGGYRDVGEKHSDYEGQRREPVVRHE